MIQLIFTPPKTDEWNQWINDCKDETTRLIESYNNGNPKKINETLYKAQNNIFLGKPFHGKCAYCESKSTIDSPVYVEHYRPKKEVRYIDNKLVHISGPNNSEIPHPGYYWLAYTYNNFLPTCWKCNSRHTDKSRKMIGKGNRFPVSNNHINVVGKESNEIPLIINPCNENPESFLFIDDIGRIHEKDNSEKGKITIEVFGLNEREDLLGARKKEYKNVRLKMKYFLAMNDDDVNKEEELKELIKIKEGCDIYTLAARKAIFDETIRAQQRIEDVE